MKCNTYPVYQKYKSIKYIKTHKYNTIENINTVVDVGKPMLAGYPTLDVDALASRPLQRALYIGLEMCFSFYFYTYIILGV